MQLAAIYEDKIYAITATALDGTWENYEAVFEASFRSFRVLADSPRSDRNTRGGGFPVAGPARPALFRFNRTVSRFAHLPVGLLTRVGCSERR